MEFYCLCISHQTTPLDIREKLSCTQLEASAALSYYVAHLEQFLGQASEIALLSTCNRFEVYLTFRGDRHLFVGKPDEVKQALLAFIIQITGYDRPKLAELSILFRGLEAVEHLFRVTSGLESQVIGEVQIIGQVSDALETALQARSARHTLASLFRAALHTAKRAHTETAIGKKSASLSSVAVSLAEQIVGKMNHQPVVVIGAGEMSALAVRALHARGAQQMVVVNRTYANAGHLAQQYGYQARPWEALDDALLEADVVVTATGAKHPVLTVERLREIMARRSQRPLLLLDIALPRDIESAARDLAGITLFDLDDIKQRLSQTLEHRQKEAQQVEVILQEELRAFAHWMEVIPTVGKLHRKAEKIRQQEVERALEHLPDLDPQVQEQIEILTRSLVKKLFHEPSFRMRNDVKNGELRFYTDSLHFLFGLDEEDAHPRERRESEDYD